MLRALLVVVALTAATMAFAEDRYLCTILGTGSGANMQTTLWAAPACPSLAAMGTEAKLALQCHVNNACVRTGTGAGLVAGCMPDAGVGRNVVLPAGQLHDVPMKGSNNIAVRNPDGGVVECDVHTVIP